MVLVSYFEGLFDTSGWGEMEMWDLGRVEYSFLSLVSVLLLFIELEWMFMLELK